MKVIGKMFIKGGVKYSTGEYAGSQKKYNTIEGWYDVVSCDNSPFFYAKQKATRVSSYFKNRYGEYAYSVSNDETQVQEDFLVTFRDYQLKDNPNFIST